MTHDTVIAIAGSAFVLSGMVLIAAAWWASYRWRHDMGRALYEGGALPGRLHPRWGGFSSADVRMLDDGRTVELLSTLYQYDRQGRITDEVHAGFRSDGATIPRPVWWLVGGPWSGRYRRASVPHDLRCRERDPRGSWDAHAAFYRGARADGANPVLALLVWAAVVVFGPRWSRREIAP